MVDFDSTLKWLDCRIENIKKAVDDHLISIHGRKNLEKFKDVETAVRIRYLTENFKLIDETKRMRIIDQVQSYNILDSDNFHRIKSVADALEENPKLTLEETPAAQADEIEFSNIAPSKID